jgi:hypothetical protein
MGPSGNWGPVSSVKRRFLIMAGLLRVTKTPKAGGVAERTQGRVVTAWPIAQGETKNFLLRDDAPA